MSQRAMTRWKCLFNCLQCVWSRCHERARARVICKMLCCSQLGPKTGSPSAHSQSEGKSFLQVLRSCFLHRHKYADRKRGGGLQPCPSSHLINLIKQRADGDVCLSPLHSGMNNEFNGSHLDKSNLSLQRNQRDRARRRHTGNQNGDALATF